MNLIPIKTSFLMLYIYNILSPVQVMQQPFGKDTFQEKTIFHYVLLVKILQVKLFVNVCKYLWVLWCSGYHICFTRRRS